ncbi:diguanylate cyclase domain-containing protein [Desulfovibrio inopinatus]|uniref:diguanylate cyclase domain-containing protein n=1 Tax=Desulfovibrio inopinatus TaxID=102109 RepID=UPI00146FC62F|nr:diguanylate cyclase [Desulfovibrio inopinatus]
MLLDTLLDLSFDPICLIDERGIIVFANEAFGNLTGYMCKIGSDVFFEDIIGPEALRDLETQLHAADKIYVTSNIRLCDGRLLPVAIKACLIHNKRHRLFVMRPMQDMPADREMEHQALHDPLTGLPNRAQLTDRLKQSIAQAKLNNLFMAVVFIDLDEFKPINDTYGHECGDFVLVSVAQTLQETIRDCDMVARIGGDEFIILLNELKNGLHAGLTANRLIKAITQPLQWGEHLIGVSASLGVAVCPTHDDDPEGLLKKADDAMYLAKKSGKNGYAFFGEGDIFS